MFSSEAGQGPDFDKPWYIIYISNNTAWANEKQLSGNVHSVESTIYDANRERNIWKVDNVRQSVIIEN